MSKDAGFVIVIFRNRGQVRFDAACGKDSGQIRDVRGSKLETDVDRK